MCVCVVNRPPPLFFPILTPPPSLPFPSNFDGWLEAPENKTAWSFIPFGEFEILDLTLKIPSPSFGNRTKVCVGGAVPHLLPSDSYTCEWRVHPLALFEHKVVG